MNEESTVPPIAESSENNTAEVLVFQLNQQKFSVEIERVAEIIRYREPTHVPNTASFLEGIISFRGKIIPVIDGRKRFGWPPSKPDLKTSIIVVRDEAELYGILVDSSLQVIPVQRNDIVPPSSKNFPDLVRGIFTHKNQSIYLLNLSSFLQF